jgi:hypothetical protein
MANKLIKAKKLFDWFEIPNQIIKGNLYITVMYFDNTSQIEVQVANEQIAAMADEYDTLIKNGVINE